MTAHIWHLYGLSVPMSRAVEVPDGNSAMLISTVAIQRLPTEPIGTFTLTLTNVVVGSTLRVESQAAGTELYAGTAATSSPVITLSCYSSGNPLNDLRIKVRKGTTAPKYLPFETLATAVVGSASIFVAQVPDTIA